MSEAENEPDWLKDFVVEMGDRYIWITCSTCRTSEPLDNKEGITLWDLKLWAYYHIEECGK